ncbi:hypothetical protein HFO56_03400 [Rhizobium laguerreae]|uniref:hypothetical protein n=1 Tax=Rhizobium laguerreae TaxID=1076926 RepID=UPI001C917A6B|nr:hypothetical protein [Rhizobium laguerreae]MBY3151434.1 hypothetical protein [Rhizobium laguerreae]
MMNFAHWQQEAHGAMSLQIGEDELRLTPMLSGWQLHGPKFSWVSDHLDEMVGICEFYEGYLKRQAERRNGKTATYEEDLRNGFLLTASASPSGRFEVRIRLDGAIVGQYDGFLNSARATFVLGQDTIQGAELLEPVARRRGFGDKMRDAAERVTGLTAVPHGRNFTPGTLSSDAAKSWDRRAARREVPGYGDDLATKMRFRMVDLCLARRRRMEQKSLDLLHALALGEKTGCALMVGFVGERPVCGWGIAKNGLPIDPSGVLDQSHLREGSSIFCQRGEAVRFKQMTFRKADAIVKNWRESVKRIHWEYADDMASLIASPRFERILEVTGRQDQLARSESMLRR